MDTILNYFWTDLDQIVNGAEYAVETLDTGVIYGMLNMMTAKIYIGKVTSYEKHGAKPPTKYGAKGRFKRHWSNRKSSSASEECPVFYEALRNSKISDWFVMTLHVCGRGHLKEWETKYTLKYKASDPEYGYNIFVGDNKPNSELYLQKYRSAKATSNVSRAVNGQMRRSVDTKNLPQNINYRLSKKRDGSICGEGYFVQIKINGVLYNKAFLAMSESMESKLKRAIAQLEIFKNIK